MADRDKRSRLKLRLSSLRFTLPCLIIFNLEIVWHEVVNPATYVLKANEAFKRFRRSRNYCHASGRNLIYVTVIAKNVNQEMKDISLYYGFVVFTLLSDDEPSFELDFVVGVVGVDAGAGALELLLEPELVLLAGALELLLEPELVLLAGAL